MGGIEATRRIVDAGPVRILVLTTFDLDEYVFAALRAGASGFLLKDAPPGDLGSAIRAVATGDAVVAPGVTRRLIDTFAGHLPAPAAGRSTLEEELLGLTRAGARRADGGRPEAGPTRDRPSPGGVGGDGQDPCRPGLRKLNPRDRVQLVVFAYEAGIIRPGEE